ncbi:MAG TPA: undecaprenyl-diphosphate phosphatase, partial [Firmicutes bacterium]|nr:undecaprenyl-diphosphate phosphatase [Bacillota bacterium]
PFFARIYDSYITVGFMLLVTGLMLHAISFLPRGARGIEEMRYADALFISFAQGIAIIPGISRSGATITAALARKLGIAAAVKFSFLMSIPAILGATVVEAKDLITDGLGEIHLIPYFAAALFAFLAGVVAIKTFVRLLQAQKFNYFAYYCWFAGVFVIVTALL